MATEAMSQDEFESLSMERQITDESSQDYARRMFQEHAPAAAVAICKLALYSDSERIRLQAAQYVVERIIGRIQDDPPPPVEDPYKSLLLEVTEYVQGQAAVNEAHNNGS